MKNGNISVGDDRVFKWGSRGNVINPALPMLVYFVAPVQNSNSVTARNLLSN